MDIISCVKEYIAACPLLSEIAAKKRHINWLDDDPDNYGIYPSGDEVIDEYINGDEVRLYTFAVEIRKMSDSDVKRLEAAGFMENLQEWFDKNIPEFPDNCEVYEVRAQNAMIFDMDKAGKKGTYQVQISIKYIKYYGG